MIRVIGLDQSAADSSACERLKGSRVEKESVDRDNSQVASVSPSRSRQECHSQDQVQGGDQNHSQTMVCDLDQRTTPLLVSTSHDLQGSGLI